jgi:hypothetical protein
VRGLIDLGSFSSDILAMFEGVSNSYLYEKNLVMGGSQGKNYFASKTNFHIYHYLTVGNLMRAGIANLRAGIAHC